MRTSSSRGVAASIAGGAERSRRYRVCKLCCITGAGNTIGLRGGGAGGKPIVGGVFVTFVLMILPSLAAR